MSDKWAEHKEKFCGCKDAHRHNKCQGRENCELPLGHPEREPATEGHILLIDQVKKCQKAMKKWPKWLRKNARTDHDQ